MVFAKRNHLEANHGQHSRTAHRARYHRHDGQPTTTSRDITETFGKRHDDVLKRIRSLDCSPEYHARNFAEMIIEVEIGKGATRKDPAYRITRDGFAFLCMGFTGAKAAQWKERYINTFNKMADKLADHCGAATQKVSPPRQTRLGRPAFTPLSQRWLVSLDGERREVVQMVAADALVVMPGELPRLLLGRDSPISTAQACDIAIHASLRMLGEVCKLEMNRDLERLKKQICDLHTTDLIEVAKQAWAELSMRPTGPAALEKEKNQLEGQS